jgi:hypothetical protein
LQFADGPVSVNSLACFAGGTRIATPGGAVAVEALVAGDPVCSAFGGTAPVAWIGHRDVACARHPHPSDVHPVRVRAAAFGPGLPVRDLFLSPDHAVFVNGVLIPVRHLVNGRTIAQVPASHITYYHVELPVHDVVLAEGLPCESYLDTGNRGAFANGNGALHLHPDFALRIWDSQACARLVCGGAELAEARRLLLANAMALGHRTTDDPNLLVVADGRVLHAEVLGTTHRIRLPAQVDSIQLVSRSAAPAELGHAGADQRRLGVAISRLALGGETIPLTDPRLTVGWYDFEHGPTDAAWRWTDGSAGLIVAGSGVLELELAITGRYWLEPGAAGVAQNETGVAARANG